MYKYLILISILFITEVAALDIISVNDKTTDINLSPKSEVFFDSMSRYDYKTVSSELFHNDFVPIESKSISAGFTDDTVWTRFSIKNDDDKIFYGELEIPIPWIDVLDVYIQVDDVLSVKKLGSSFSFKQRDINSRSFFIPINIQPQKTATVYIKAQSISSITLAPHLCSTKNFSDRLTHIAMFNGALIGIIFIMFLYNLNMYLTLEDDNYLYYILYLVGLLFFMGTYYGYNYQLLWSNSPNFNENTSSLIIVFSFFAGLLFTRNFLNSAKYFPKIDIFLSILMYLFLILGIFSFIIESKLTIIYMIVFLAVLYSIGLIYISMISMIKKISGSKYFLIAWLISAVTLILSSAMVQGYVDYSHFLYDFFGYGMVSNLLFLSFALIDRTKDVRAQSKSVIKQESALIDDLHKSKEKLQHSKEKLQYKIDVQTVQLREKDKELKKISIKDELTGLYNRVKLEELLSNELHRSKRYYDNFSIMVVNIDGLKKINDTQSYEVGNSVIKEISDLLIKSIRYIDTVGRWSDTEFLILCPETTAENAVIASEHLQTVINNYKFFFVGSARVSFGVTASLLDDSGQDIIQRAYDALSNAKKNGKNRIEVL